MKFNFWKKKDSDTENIALNLGGFIDDLRLHIAGMKDRNGRLAEKIEGLEKKLKWTQTELASVTEKAADMQETIYAQNAEASRLNEKIMHLKKPKVRTKVTEKGYELTITVEE
ncbi:MAG: hypothetical protein RR091_10300 [Cloacibacillus sp.]